MYGYYDADNAIFDYNRRVNRIVSNAIISEQKKVDKINAELVDKQVKQTLEEADYIKKQQAIVDNEILKHM